MLASFSHDHIPVWFRRPIKQRVHPRTLGADLFVFSWQVIKKTKKKLRQFHVGALVLLGSEYTKKYNAT